MLSNYDEETQSVESFVEYMIDDERTEYTHQELRALAYNTHTSGSKLRMELAGYGLKLAERRPEKAVRGFKTSSHDRWHGPGSSRTHGGSGWEQIAGFAGQKG